MSVNNPSLAETESRSLSVSSRGTIVDMTSPDLGYIGHTSSGSFDVFIAGRSVGSFGTEAEATLRLAHVDQFRAGIENVSTDKLQAIHERLHSLGNVDADLVTAHDVIEATLSERQVVAGVHGDPDMKMAALSAGVAKSAAARYTLGPVYVPDTPDGHDESIDGETLQKAIWDWVRADDRTVFLQHTQKAAGEMVEILTWPQAVTADLTLDGVTKSHTFPEQTPFMGVIWEPWAWELIEKGELRGYSIGGQARRVEVDLGAAAA